MASLFGKNKLREIALKLQTSDLEDKIAIVKTWHHDYHNGSLKQDKETSREQAYNQDFFIKVLGYKEKPAVPYSFEPKATTDKGQLPDAVLGHTDVAKDLKNIAAVVELKGAAIELDRPQRRDGNMSPVQQGFKYKTQYRNCPFVVVSNFWELRLYHDNQLDYELWTLDDLVDPGEDYLKFKTFYTLLHSDNLTTPKGSSKTEGWLSDIRFEQEEIGKKFYKVYREARLELLRDIYRQNESVRNDIDMGIEKSQKIIDRIVFACFAEDRGLLPDDTIRRVIDDSDKSSFGSSLWNTFKSFFEAIDVGDEKLEIPDGYNGGLFAHDAVLNSLRIADEPLRRVVKLSDYNFVEDLSVTILGHIFEQSISDLEEIKSKVQESQNLESLQQSRRKKDGIFYTPDYIVRYIVDNSLGVYLRESEEKLKEEFKLKGDITDKTYEKREKQAYSKYQQFLHEVKVVDPACGSGAFLVYVFDYLMAENQRVANILGNNLFSGEDYIKSILKNNIYGVDLNDESVEITKLSLWLKSAQKGKKLTTLDNNIKCGNSLISDSSVAGDKAFDWQDQFPEIFAKGGFDVVVGNPPYVRVQNIGNKEVDYYFNKYQSPSGKLDLSILFFEKSLDLVSDMGKIAFVSSSQWIQTDYGRKIRLILSKGFIEEIIDFGSLPVFQDADTYPAIFTITKRLNDKLVYGVISVKDQLNDSSIKSVKKIDIDYSRLGEAAWQFNDFNLIEKLNSKNIDFVPLSSLGRAYIGDLTGMDEAFVLTKTQAKSLGLEQDLLLPYAYRGNEVTRFGRVEPEAVVIYPYTRGDKGEAVLMEEVYFKEHYPKTYTYLETFKPSLQKRLDSRKIYATGSRWFRHLRPGSFLYIEPRKLIFKGIDVVSTVATLDENTAFNGANCPAIIITNNDYSFEYIASILNSRLVTQYLNSISPKKLGGYYRYSATNISRVPIIKPTDDTLHRLSNIAFSLKKKHTEKSHQFLNVIQAEYDVEKLSPKLNRWWQFDFTHFTKCLKVKLSLAQKSELIQLFEKYKTDCIELEAQIQKTDQEIDKLVYSVYGLTQKEIAIIENVPTL